MNNLSISYYTILPFPIILLLYVIPVAQLSTQILIAKYLIQKRQIFSIAYMISIPNCYQTPIEDNQLLEILMKKLKELQAKAKFEEYSKSTSSMGRYETENRSYRKIPNDVGSGCKENEKNWTNWKSYKNIGSRVEERKYELGKSQAFQQLNNSCYVPRQKQTKNRIKWELQQEQHQFIPLKASMSSISNPGLKSKHSSKYSSSNYDYSHQHETNLEMVPKTRAIPQTGENQVSGTEIMGVGNRKNNAQAKSSKFVSFFDSITDSSIPTPKFRHNELTYLQSSTGYTPINEPPLKDFSSTLGSNKFKQLYEKYGEKHKMDRGGEWKSKSISVGERSEKIIRSKSEAWKSVEGNKQPKLSDFVVGECKGEGGFAKVYMAIHKKTGLICALKKVKKESVKYMLDQFIQEIKIQLFLNHPKLVKVYGYFSDAEYFYILIEYMEDGSLYSLMKKKKKIDEIQVAEKLNQICQGIKQMHDNSIVHRDLKPQNIVMSHGVCKICDFGWAAICQNRRQTYCGTLDYVCPEIIQGNSYDSGVDIWCIGVLAYELMCGKAPFYDISRKKTLQKIKSCKIESYPGHLSKKAIQFIEMILTKDPEARTGIAELMGSEFLKGGLK